MWFVCSRSMPNAFNLFHFIKIWCRFSRIIIITLSNVHLLVNLTDIIPILYVAHAHFNFYHSHYSKLNTTVSHILLHISKDKISKPTIPYLLWNIYRYPQTYPALKLDTFLCLPRVICKRAKDKTKLICVITGAEHY